jgi:hypothetical protein
MATATELAAEYKLTYSIVSRAHHLAAKSCARFNGVLGIPVVALTAALGTSIFYTIENSPSSAWKILAGLLALLAAVLSALQTSMGFSEKAEAHRLAGIRYAGIRRELELLMLKMDSGTGVNGIAELEALSRRLADLAEESPTIPLRLYEVAKRRVARKTQFPELKQTDSTTDSLSDGTKSSGRSSA